MRRSILLVLTAAISTGTVAGCSGHPSTGPTGSSTTASTTTAASTAASPPATAGSPASGGSKGAGDRPCAGGLAAGQPGVLSVTCTGTADVRIQVAGLDRDIHGGVCRTAADIWTVAVGVIIDRTGTHGTYTGPPVDSVTVNNTTTPGKATIQAVLDGKLYFDLGNAQLTLTDGGRAAHVAGISESASDAPKAPITVDITC